MEPLAAIDRCPGCGGTARRPVLARGPVKLVRCGACGLVHATAGYEPAFLDDHYAQRLAHDPPKTAQGPRPGSERKRPAFALYDRLTHGRLSQPGPNATALDIGCSTGWLLDLFAEAGYRTYGVERSPSAIEAQAAGHRVHAVDIETGVDLPERFDVVTMTHLLEHLRDPCAALGWARRQLRPGGLAIVEVPNWDDVARPLWGSAYRPLELGDHLSFFSRDTLADVARRSGFSVQTLWSAPQARTLVFPSLLTGLDLGLGAARRLRGGKATSPTETESVGVAARRVTPSGGRWQHRLISGILRGLDRLDPLLERAAGSQWRHGANLVAILEPSGS